MQQYSYNLTFNSILKPFNRYCTGDRKHCCKHQQCLCTMKTKKRNVHYTKMLVNTNPFLYSKKRICIVCTNKYVSISFLRAATPQLVKIVDVYNNNV